FSSPDFSTTIDEPEEEVPQETTAFEEPAPQPLENVGRAVREAMSRGANGNVPAEPSIEPAALAEPMPETQPLAAAPAPDAAHGAPKDKFEEPTKILRRMTAELTDGTHRENAAANR
ncbi:MAG: hypothetical protein LBO78_03985, partial [Rickettsiales bacterium]|nr:hypothetical protein [Rickettsiales bacterium]